MKLASMRSIEDLECPFGKKDALFFDGGFGVRATKGAAKGSLANKTFVIQYTVAGQKRRMSIGSCVATTLADARKAAAKAMGLVAQDRDPAKERREAVEKARETALTLSALIEQWEQRHLSTKRASYAHEAPKVLRRVFQKQLKSTAARLAPKATLLDLAERKPPTARLAWAYGSALYGWAIEKDLVKANPFAGIKMQTVAARERVLTDEEIRSIWNATEGPGSFNAVVRMLIVTGQRLNEVASMTWSEINPDLSVWTIPGSKAKNKVTHLVPLSSQSRTIIEAAPRVDGQTLVFPGRRGAFNGWSKAKAQLDEASGVKDWRLHDLRRTMATGLQKLGVRLEVTEAVLNHVSGSRAGIVGVYQRHEWKDEKHTALTAWGARVAAIVEGSEAEGNVTQLHARRA